MKKSIPLLFILLLFILSSFCFALDSSIWYKFPVPEYSYSQAYITAPDILEWKIYEDYSEVLLKPGLSFNLFSQTENFKCSHHGDLLGIWYRQKDDTDKNTIIDWKEVHFNYDIEIERYFSVLNLWGSGNLMMKATDNFECQTGLTMDIGSGLGRIVSCVPVADAIRLAHELDINADDKAILDIAAILGEKSKYQHEYKDTWPEVFYQEIAQMIGLPEMGLKVRRILSSKIYQAVQRSRGWELRLGYGNVFFTGTEPQPKGYITIVLDYELPWGLNKQFSLILDYDKNLEDESSVFSGNVHFGLDHSLAWVSYIDLGYHETIGNSIYLDDDSGFIISAGTAKNIFNRLVSKLSLIYRTDPYYLEPKFDLNIELEYYLW